MNELGKMIGVVTDNFSVKNDKGQEVKLRVKFDYTTCSDTDIKSWLNGNRRIAMQRPLRGLSVKEIEALDGTVVMANECGRKVKSREEQIGAFMAAFINAGMEEDEARELAETAVSNPHALRKAEESARR